MKIAIIVSALALILSGCASTYNYTSDTVSSINVPDRVKGAWAYSIDDSVREARRFGFKPSGHVCSLHTYNFNAGAAIESGIRRAMGEFLESGTEQKTAASASPRLIAFRLDNFQPRFSCAVGVTEGTCTGIAEITLAVTVLKDGERRSFTVSSERSGDAPAGQMCSNALGGAGEATRKAVRDVVERAMERIVTIAK